MKMISRFIMVLGVGLFSFSGTAQAVTFTVSDIGFTLLSGNNEALKWSVASATAPITHDIAVDDSWTFTYGTFTITSNINSPAGADDDDTFTASFNVMPPNPAAAATRIGSPDATYVQGGVSGANEQADGWVDFINTEMERSFGNGGMYYISFLDTSPALKDVAQDLQATIRLVSEAEVGGGGGGGAAAVVPEPSTFVLLGAGLLGLAVYRRKKQ